MNIFWEQIFKSIKKNHAAEGECGMNWMGYRRCLPPLTQQRLRSYSKPPGLQVQECWMKGYTSKRCATVGRQGYGQSVLRPVRVKRLSEKGNARPVAQEREESLISGKSEDAKREGQRKEKNILDINVVEAWTG